MHLTTYYDGVALYRRNKAIIARFLKPHLVLSTCREMGGLRPDIGYVLNYQCCEPKNHSHALGCQDPEGYRNAICSGLNLPQSSCVVMDTAANMHHAAFVHEKFNDLEVVAVATGGVEANAGRVGDPASIMETAEGWESLKPNGELPGPGTINIMLFISRPLTEAALTRAVITATEAKCTALQELAVNSRFSDGLATGTGTDQMVVAATDKTGYRLNWAGKHTKLGELIGRTVHAAVSRTLGRQNNLTPDTQCSVKIHLERFGCTRQSMLSGISEHLEPELALLLADNFSAINNDPVIVAAVTAIVHLKDKLSWKILPMSCKNEIMGAAAAQVACAVSSRYQMMPQYREYLAASAGFTDNPGFLKLCWQALALGFSDKWHSF